MSISYLPPIKFKKAIVAPSSENCTNDKLEEFNNPDLEKSIDFNKIKLKKQ